jgi:REP element-mobilizing transposase RayT
MKNIKKTGQTTFLHPRCLTRLKDFDYSRPGAYFVTICTQAKLPVFGTIINEKLALNTCGTITESCWLDIPRHYPNARLDEYVIMPNHVHGIIILEYMEPQSDKAPAGLKPAATGHPLSEIVRAFKTFSARKVNQLRNSSGNPVWQRNYYEHVIRSELELNQIRDYINNNPLRFALNNENAAIDSPLTLI